MHIAIIADPIDKQKAGIHYLTRHLVSNLLKFDKKNTYSIIRFSKDNDQDNSKTIILKNLLPFIHNDPIRTFITLPILLRKLKPDLVIETAHFGPFNLPKKIKRVTIIHDLSPVRFPEFHPFFSQILQRLFFPGIIKRADLLITNSENTSQDLLKIYPKSADKTTKILLGKEGIFKPTLAGNILAKHNISEPYFLNVGTIEPRKNLITLLEAFSLFKNETKSNALLVIVGAKGWKTASFYLRLNSHPFKNDIKLIGYVDRADLPILYSKALAFIYPSFYEGFGLPVLEAMACGIPCIVSNTSSLPEVGGEAALYFNPEKPEELAEKLKYISTEKEVHESMKEASIKQASRFSWEKYTQEFIDELEIRFGKKVSSKPVPR